MKFEPLKLCWADLGDGQVCQRPEGHDGDHDPDARNEFDMEAVDPRRFTVAVTKSGRRLTAADIEALAVEAERGYDPETFRWVGPSADRLREALDSVAETGFSAERLRARAEELLARGPVPTYTCPHCEKTTTNPDDIANRYCGECHHFCDDQEN